MTPSLVLPPKSGACTTIFRVTWCYFEQPWRGDSLSGCHGCVLISLVLLFQCCNSHAEMQIWVVWLLPGKLGLCMVLH